MSWVRGRLSWGASAPGWVGNGRLDCFDLRRELLRSRRRRYLKAAAVSTATATIATAVPTATIATATIATATTGSTAEPAATTIKPAATEAGRGVDIGLSDGGLSSGQTTCSNGPIHIGLRLILRGLGVSVNTDPEAADVFREASKPGGVALSLGRLSCGLGVG